MTVIRDVQTSLIEGMERPVGPVLESVQYGDNADLIAAVAPLYLTGSVLDVTYGKGKWWTRYQPNPFTYHDLELDGVDFRALPYADREFDTVVFDPPYVESGSRNTSSRGNFLESYGLGTEERYTPGDIRYLQLDGLKETCRVARAFVLVKCMEYVAWHKFNDAPTRIINAAREHGWQLHDRIVHVTGGGIGANFRIKTVLRARRSHSYLLVFSR